MKFIQLTCSKCSATMMLEKHGSYSSISCPYCGSNTDLLIESDRVKVAQIREDTERLGMALSYREHQDYLVEAHSLRKIQIAVICVFALIAIILTVIFLVQDPAGCLF